MVLAEPPFRVRQLTIEDGMDVAMWRYPGAWAVADALEAPRPDEGYWALVDARDVLVGLCALGAPARPGGLPEAPATLDVQIGIRPELLGQGLGADLGRAAVDYARRVAPGASLRCAVREDDGRGLRVAEAAGFATTGRHELDGRRYIVLRVPASERG